MWISCQQSHSPVLWTTGNHTGYTAICAKALRLGWPRLWAEDLYVRDRGRLEMPGTPLAFAWAVRETGTFLLLAGNADDLETAKALLFNREKKGCWPEQRYYWFSGTALRSLPLETIIERLKRYRT